MWLCCAVSQENPSSSGLWMWPRRWTLNSSISFGHRGSKGQVFYPSRKGGFFLGVKKIERNTLQSPSQIVSLQSFHGNCASPEVVLLPGFSQRLSCSPTWGTHESGFTFALWTPDSCGETRWSSWSPALFGGGSRSYAFHCHNELTLRAGNMPLCLVSPWTFWAELKRSHEVAEATSERVTSRLTSQRAWSPGSSPWTASLRQEIDPPPKILCKNSESDVFRFWSLVHILCIT